MLLDPNVWFCEWLSRVLSWKMRDKCSDTGSAFMFNRHWIKLRKSPKGKCQNQVSLLRGEQPTHCSLIQEVCIIFFYVVLLQGKEESIQIKPEWLKHPWYIGDLNQDLLRWRRKVSSILSQPGGVPLLPNNHLENWGAGGMWDRCQGSFERKRLRSHCSAQISAQPACATLF